MAADRTWKAASEQRMHGGGRLGHGSGTLEIGVEDGEIENDEHRLKMKL